MVSPSAAAGTAALLVMMLGAVAAWAQYPGQITKKSKDAPDLRAIAVLEWTGEIGKPKACRMVPVTVFDGEKLQDAGVYLARPEPLALTGEVEYELKENGKTFGLFDISNAAQEQGTWVGYGKWKPMPAPKAAKADAPQKVDVDDVEDDKPVLHRKKHSGEGSSGGPTAGSGSASSPGTSSSDDDPDRPKLHKKSSDDSGAGTSTAHGGGAPVSDPDTPTLHKKPADDTTSTASSSSSSTTADPDRPVIKKGKQKPPDDVGHVDSLPDITDADRPRLKRGKSSGNGIEVAPTLMGLPPDMQQAVAVSDSKNHPEHPWTYAWANPDDEAKMKAAVEDMARQELGLSNPAPAAKAAAPRRTTTVAAKKAVKAPPSVAPAPLVDEQFRVFELAYGSGATLVLTAHTDGPITSQKYVTIVAQPDLYGNVRALLKSVTDIAHLDETPRMRLVDAVDALADNRGELLFELRGDGQRQFALYRIYRGTAEKLFVSGGGVYGTVSSD
jgi:hypothetical protein